MSTPLLSQTDEMDLRKIEISTDSVFLSLKSPEKVLSEISNSNLKAIQREHFELLLNSFLESGTPSYRRVSAASLGSYLTSRLMIRGFELTFDISLAYSLLDAIRTSSIIEIERWHFIVGKFIRAGLKNKAIIRLYKQSRRVTETNSHIYYHSECLWEKDVLRLSNEY